MRFVAYALWGALALSGGAGAALAAEPGPAHGLAMHGDLKYPPDFKHFDYVNPDAPKGGAVRLGAMGAFDTLNPLTLKGEAAPGLTLTLDTLMVAAADEPFSKYGLIAQSVEMPEDRSSVTFTLRSEAVWSDGTPVSADDVAFSLETLRTQGLPLYNMYYSDVAKVEVLGPKQVRFVFKTNQNRELPLIVGEMPILPKHYWQGRDFSAPTLEAPVSSGPYRIESFEPGRSITYARRPDYWGRDLPVNRGQDNFDSVRYDTYRDATVLLEAFKAGAYDYRLENVARQWATGYDTPAVRDGRILMEKLPHHRTAGMQGFIYNLRRPLFQDPRVREALAYAFDFEWTNQTLFHSEYSRMRSYFDNSELSAIGLPDAAELALLEPLRDQIPRRVFTEAYQPPVVDEAQGGLRSNLARALALLGEAGWTVRDGALRNADGTPFAFEILLVQPEFERVVLPFARNLERLGIKLAVRTVDTAQYMNRLSQFDYDMIVSGWGQSESPGNEQRDFWSQAAATTPGSSNYAGFVSPAVDRLVESLIKAPSRPDLITRVRALDRVLQWSFLVIPQWYQPADRVAYWNIFGRPAQTPRTGLQFMTWWVDPAKVAALGGRGGR
ncbi:extracellular solute-binding protein [Pararhodospirillum photometricum]|uniref:Extracellular solute-binding protein, family 5 n=1 Tax=Pararhodospirillum photometricum DSM 122 TaxID=1150469 RepID=H6SJG8_PARPM|nr:extracellular solute-binding protein [Pararhodospirillum photometricum]CCG08133.1 Extracellular solute-binding protein, family 5 [Pararhodospirillum photometricum DSM 122]